ncbi:MAG: hypothetical protein BMS9Abin29_1215 [Gemmatimonadota bacterium]|nr:MAG: hypothetical protein BMS9Abin29_1215 [Gemmatimonadota bacterium]
MSDARKIPAHRGMATWGERLVPLDDFREAALGFGRLLRAEERVSAISAFVAADADPTPVEGPYERVAVFGGIYSNTHALVALLENAAQRGVEAVYCLGDFGGFGPNPEKVWPLLEAGGVRSIQGNYEESLASGRTDCNCGYADPRDNRFADLSYRYTEQSCSMGFKAYMGGLPQRRRIRVGTSELLLVHGSPRRINEFLFESTSPVPFLETMCAEIRADGFLCSHTGLHWHRALPSGCDVVNVGVIGRPANDGRTDVWYTLLSAERDGMGVEFVPLAYDHLALADEMRRAQLPEEFVRTVLTGWWTTCLEVLPARERAASAH